MSKMPYQRSGVSLSFFFRKHPCPDCGGRTVHTQVVNKHLRICSPHGLSDEELKKFQESIKWREYRTLGLKCKKCGAVHSAAYQEKYESGSLDRTPDDGNKAEK